MPTSSIPIVPRPAGTGDALRLTEMLLCGWLGCAAPGDTLEYHRGFLAVDTNSEVSRVPGAERHDLIRVAHRALWAANQGFVHLVQRRLGVDEFSYRMIARPRPSNALASLSALLTDVAA